MLSEQSLHQDGKIPLDRFAAILEVFRCIVDSSSSYYCCHRCCRHNHCHHEDQQGDPVWKESVPQSLKQKIIQVGSNDGGMLYSEQDVIFMNALMMLVIATILVVRFWVNQTLPHS